MITVTLLLNKSCENRLESWEVFITTKRTVVSDLKACIFFTQWHTSCPDHFFPTPDPLKSPEKIVSVTQGGRFGAAPWLVTVLDSGNMFASQAPTGH